jgi:hypothetical protein
MASQVLALPLANLVMQVGNNEDWVDALKYVINQPGGDPNTWPQLDIRGIDFEMEIRRSPPDNEVILHATSAAGSLTVGASPNYGCLVWYMPLATMQTLQPGSYVGDVRASDDYFERVCLTIDLTILEGITR